MTAPKPSASNRPASNRRTLRDAMPRLFVVADRSMEPRLCDGQGLVAIASRRARAGQIRCVEHPDRPGFWLVKRVHEVHDDATMTVLSDNRSATLADSRSFGPVPIDGSYRVVLTVPRRIVARLS